MTQSTGKWFHPSNLLDKTYEIGLFIKGFDGAVELISGVLVLAIPRSVILHLTELVTRHELASDPHDFIANHVYSAGLGLAVGSHWFAALFLLTHGIIKLGLVLALLRQKHWAYPWALVILTAFLIYQIYLLIVRATFGMGFLTALDIAIIWLIWREWQQVKLAPAKAAEANPQ